MSGMIPALLLLAAIACFTQAQFNEAGQQCLCQRVRKGIMGKNEIKDIQIYQATAFCRKVEIVVTYKNGLRVCLDPELKIMKRAMAAFMKKQNNVKAKPTNSSSTPGSTLTTSN
ncbi:C-X-C motif chemokine 6-like [Oryzias latipes]|uniref:Chemokine interleukin-8-like domain-containing protein n=1 Tax=Oryzias latipes TaxID=8090 RepID=H2LK41_ORYLA|nr:C-X-C motif chemokine 6-like [Oryzias latipes]